LQGLSLVFSAPDLENGDPHPSCRGALMRGAPLGPDQSLSRKGQKSDSGDRRNAAAEQIIG
jgi:hypothetical protein